MDTVTDTIAAIATATGEAGISIVRISGPEALSIADRIFCGHARHPSSCEGGTFLHGFVRTGAEGTRAVDIDEVVLLVYRAPKSYTREDVVEIQGHGGRISAQRILRATLDAGARPAEPGEFTRRAFLNGRIDLMQAEAVADLIRARSDRAADAAVEQLEGRLSSLFKNTYDDILGVVADLEATLDFLEDELPESTLPDITGRIDLASCSLRNALETWNEGHLLREGALVAIAGRPNVGKSTLMNRLLGSARSIVTATPGTTRDTIEEHLILEGVPIRLVDTAGLREADCRIEQEGIERANTVIGRADLLVYMVDASRPRDADDDSNISRLRKRNICIILNKNDLGCILSPQDYPGIACVSCSLTQDRSLDDVRALLVELLGATDTSPHHAVISERHRHIIQNALNELNAGRELLSSGTESDVFLVAGHLREALERLGQATGRIYTDELLDAVFSRFCVGK